MKQIIVVVVLVSFFCLGGPSYVSLEYEAHVFRSGERVPMLHGISVGGQRLVDRSQFYCVALEGGKRIALQAHSAPEYSFRNQVFASRKTLSDQGGRPFADIRETVRFFPQRMELRNEVTVLRDFTVAETWLNFREILFLPTAQMVLTTLEETSHSGEKNTALIPRKFSRNTWGYRGKFARQIRLIRDRHAVTVTAEPGTSILFNHYGGKQIELCILCTMRPYQLALKGGDVKTFGCTITVERL